MKKYFGVLQRIGKSLMLPVALLPAAGILMGLGNFMQNIDIVNYLPFIGVEKIQMIANIMASSGEIIFNNLPLIFAVGVAIGMSEGEGVSALAAIVGFLIMNMTSGVLLGVTMELTEKNPMYSLVLGIPTIQTGVFGGILVGILTALIYTKFHKTELPQFLGFFQGKRLVPIISSIMGLLLGVIMALIWPSIQAGLYSFSNVIVSSNLGIASFIFGVVERALIPFGLHHIWYNPFWYQFGEYVNKAGQIVIGDQPIFFAQLKDGVEFTSGAFMTGKYPFMMFGLPAAALAMYHEADKENKKGLGGLLFSGALTSILTGITEPIEFMFLFVAPALFVIHCVFAGLSFMIMDILNVRIGLTFSGGLIDFTLFGIAPNRTKWWLSILVGIIFAIIYYLSFRILIRKFNLKTPGREGNERHVEVDLSDIDFAKNLIEAFGGKNNIKYLDACITRLRVTVDNISLINRSRIKSLGALDLMIIGNNVQGVFGTNSDILKEQLKDIIDGKEIKIKKKNKLDSIKKGRKLDLDITLPVSGKIIRLEEVEDPIFSMKLIGDGFAIDPKEGIVVAPISGKVTSISKTNHAITIKNDNLEIFIHIGIDSINLNGEGFKRLVNEGDIVQEGQLLIDFSLEKLEEKAKSKVIPIIFKNLDKDIFIYFEENTFGFSGSKKNIEIHEIITKNINSING